MRAFLLCIFCLTIFVLSGTAQISDVIAFATVEKSKQLLSEEDSFTSCWSQFDIDSRMHKAGSSKDNLMEFIQEQVRPWSDQNRSRIKNLLGSLDQNLADQGIKLPLPEQIYLVKTTMAEEGGAGAYTRGHYIIFGEELSSLSDEQFIHVFLHELFHVLSRNNEELRSSLYALFGFHITNSIDYPEEIIARRITNPDAPQTDHFIRLKAGEIMVDCMMVLYSDRPYESGDFFEYLQVGFLRLAGEEKKTIYFDDNRPTIYAMSEVTDFFEQIGKNTNYIIHPEEISAENFASALLNQADLPNPEIAVAIRALLK